MISNCCLVRRLSSASRVSEVYSSINMQQILLKYTYQQIVDVSKPIIRSRLTYVSSTANSELESPAQAYAYQPDYFTLSRDNAIQRTCLPTTLMKLEHKCPQLSRVAQQYVLSQGSLWLVILQAQPAEDYREILQTPHA